MTSPRRLPPAVLALTAGDLGPGDVRAGRGERGLRAVALAAAGGLRGVLVREPRLADGEFLEWARGVRRALGPDGWLGLHDRAHLTVAAGADGVHVGFRSLAPHELRRFLPDAVAVGWSTHAGDDPRSWTAADYVFHGPVRATRSKEGILEPIGFEALRRACAASPRPVWALGGLEAADAGAVRAAGCAGLAVLSGVLPTERPADAAASYLAQWTAAEATDDRSREGDRPRG